MLEIIASETWIQEDRRQEIQTICLHRLLSRCRHVSIEANFDIAIILKVTGTLDDVPKIKAADKEKKMRKKKK